MNAVIVWRLHRRLNICKTQTVIFMKKLISLITVLAVMIGTLRFTVTYSAENSAFVDNVGVALAVYGDGGGGFYILSNFEGKYKITHLNSDFSVNQYGMNTSCESLCYTFVNNKFYFLDNSAEIGDGQITESVILTVYDCNEEYAYKRSINNINILPDRSFGVDGNGNILIPQDTTVEVYSENGKHIDSYKTDENCMHTAAATDGNIFWCSMIDSLDIITDGEISSFNVDCNKITACEDSRIITDRGELYKYNGNFLEYCGSFDEGNIGIGVVDGYVIGMKDGKLTAVSDDNTFNVNYSDSPDFIASDNGNCAVFTQNGDSVKVAFININDIKTSDSDFQIESDNRKEYYYKSNVFIFDESKMLIYGLTPSITIAKIKQNIEYSGYDIQFIDYNGNSKTSGTIGTGGKIIFKGKEKEKAFTIIIFGDLTGEGNINSKDKKILFSYLLGKTDISEDCLIAADVNHDGRLDLKDLAAIDKFLSNKYDISQTL